MSGYEVVGRNTDRKDIDGNKVQTVTTACPDGERAIAGGVTLVSGPHVTIHESAPDQVSKVKDPDDDDPAGRWAADGWKVTVENTGDEQATVQPWVICAAVG